ncbi:MAG: Ig-like domain-containing protein [bacterium]
MKQIVLGLLVSSFLYGLEVPEPRKAFVFVPCRFIQDNGGGNEMKNLFDHEGHNYHNYRLSRFLIQDKHKPPLNPVTTLSEFENALKGGYGVFFVHTHGNFNCLIVEAYPVTKEGKEARNKAFDKYIATGYYGKEGTEIYKDIVAGKCYVIGVTKKFIQKRASLNKSLVYIAACHSFGLADDFNARNFLGYQDLSYPSISRQDVENLFYNMGGLKDDVDYVKDNDNIRFVFDYAHSVNPNLLARLNGPDMQLYLAPKILKVEVNREVGIDKEEIYTYKYPDLKYPFIDSPYPGDLSRCQKKPVKAGRLRVKIRFSEEIHPAGAKVWLEPPGSIDCVEVTHESWQKTLYANDTWKGYIDIPSNQGNKWDGTITVIAKAYDNFTEDDSSISPTGELDTDGDGMPGRKEQKRIKNNNDSYGLETCHEFEIDLTPPKIKKAEILPQERVEGTTTFTGVRGYSKDYDTGNIVNTPLMRECLHLVKITFDEPMDLTKPLNVFFSSDNHPVSFRFWSNTNTTWHGDFFIPRDQEYQGTHTLTIEGGEDLAGNTFDSDPTTEQIDPDTSNQFQIFLPDIAYTQWVPVPDSTHKQGSTHLLNIESKESIMLTGGWSPQFFPDGEWLAIWGKNTYTATSVVLTKFRTNFTKVLVHKSR